jgi:hypothetical protein
MKKLIFVLALAGAFAPSLSQAQVKIDMTRITCGEMLAMSPDEQTDFAAWISGWAAEKSGRTFIDVGLFQKNAVSVASWCAANKSESVLAGVQRALDKK